MAAPARGRFLLGNGKCVRSHINRLDMAAGTNVGKSPKKTQTPLWRRKANYVLRELVRAWHGRPYDTAVMWGFRFALDDIVHTFAKENRLNFPKLFYWFDLARKEVAECFGQRVFSVQDWDKFRSILIRSDSENRPWVCTQLTSDASFEEILFLASRLFLQEKGYTAKQFGDYRPRYSLAYYESLEVAPLDSFTIWFVKRVYGGLTET